MPKVILNRLKPQAKELIAEEQEEPEEVLCEKYLEHQQNLYHVFSLHRFKKSLWQGMSCSLITVCYEE